MMISYLKTMLAGLRQWITAQKADWSQNDETAANYIKGRPCYDTDPKMEYLVKNQAVTLEAAEGAPGDWALFQMESLIALEDGKTYEVAWDGKQYSVVAQNNHGDILLGNQFPKGGNDTGEPFLILFSRDGAFFIAGLGAGSHTFSVSTMTSKTVQLPAKYLPTIQAEKVSGLASVATSGNYNDLTDTPIIPTDIVRYATTQNLTNAQKTRARTNISAVGYEVQSLTDAQKTRARTNIGAGTSNFDGAYSSLTGAPSLAAVATSGSYNDLVERTHYEETEIKEIATFGSPGIVWESETLTISYRNANISKSLLESTPTDAIYIISLCKTTGEVIALASGVFTTYQYSSGYTYKLYALGNRSLLNKETYKDLYDATDTGEEVCFVLQEAFYNGVLQQDYCYMKAISRDNGLTNGTQIILRHNQVTLVKLDEKYIPSTIQRVGYPIILTDAQGVRWRLTVGTDGTLTTEAVTE